MIKPQDMTQRERKQALDRYLTLKRGRPAIKPAPRMSAAMGRIVRPLSKKYGPGTAKLAMEWPAIVGEKFARLSKPQRLQGGSGGATLVIMARGPAATLINAQSRQILTRVNDVLGGSSVTRLKIIQGEMGAARAPDPSRESKAPVRAKTKARRGLTPSEQDGLRKGLEKVDNDDLREALNRLGRGVLSRNDK